MDLIYTDAKRAEKGILLAFELDLAYGADENSFDMTLDRQDHKLGKGCLFYAYDSEIGGIVDGIAVDTANDIVKYSGRSWHGILNSAAILPESGQDYLRIDGEANEVIRDLISDLNLGDMFFASSEDSGITIRGYDMRRYAYAYDGIMEMLAAFGGKLLLRFDRYQKKVELRAVPVVNFASENSFDESQVDFQISQNLRPVNHIICLGAGDLSDRACIHIFTDADGTVQTFTKKTKPVQDSDYILDESQKKCFGSEEVTEVYDYPNADITLNYLPLTKKPSDWASKAENYFEIEIDEETGEATGKYKEVKNESKTRYTLMKSKPSDFDAEYDKYYVKNPETESGYSSASESDVYVLQVKKPSDFDQSFSDYYYFDDETGKYEKLEGFESVSYVKQKAKPQDWAENYGEYYYEFDPGTGAAIEYRSAEGISHDVYSKLYTKPTDWSTNKTSYFRECTLAEFEKDPKKSYYNLDAKAKWKANEYFTRKTTYSAPKWNGKPYFTKVTTVNPPYWAPNVYYTLEHDVAPAWALNTYYRKEEYEVAPAWASGAYYYEVEDRMAVMVNAAIEKLAEYYDSTTLNVSLKESDQTYDIGDVIGVYDTITGLSCTQKISKKIIKVKNADISINYEVM